MSPKCSVFSVPYCGPFLLVVVALRAGLLTPACWVMLQLSASPADGFTHRVIGYPHCEDGRGCEALLGGRVIPPGARAENRLVVRMFTGRGDGGGNNEKNGEVGMEHIQRTPAGGWVVVEGKGVGRIVEASGEAG